MKFCALMVAAGILALSALRAQEPDIVAPDVELNSGTDASASSAQILPPTTPDEADALEQSLYAGDQSVADAPVEPTAQSRPWKLNLHASAGSHYDNNIFISSSHNQSDLVTRLMAGGGITLGDYTARQDSYLTFDYAGIAELFGRHSNQDAYEQQSSFDGLLRFAHLTLGNDFEFQHMSDEDIELGTRTPRQTYADNFDARYDVDDKTYVEASGKVTITNYDIYLDSNDERGGLYFNYLLNPDLTIGLGAMGGVLNVQDSGSQTYEQLLSSVQVDATGKFTLKATAGVENRQREIGGNLITPVFEFTGAYNPFEGLGINITAFRRVLNSAYYTGYDYIATGVTVGLQYKLSSRFTLMLDTGWQCSDYQDIASSSTISRTDDYYFVHPGLRYTASAHCNVEIYYFGRKDSSTVGTSSFEDTQAGLTVNFTY